MNRRPPKNGEVREKEINTLLVDGNALFKVGYFGAKALYNDNGHHVGGVYQFLTTLRMILDKDVYHRVFIFWDGNFSGKLRYQIYEPYKSGRGKDFVNGTQPIDEVELIQRRLVWNYINEMYIRQLKHEVVESDDFIAYYCLNKKENEKITIASTDRDFCQLIKDKIRIYFLDLKVFVDSSNFSSYFCYNYENAKLMKVICGDNSDSIKGIKGVQEKTLLTHFPELAERKITLNEIIEKAQQIQEERKSKKQKPLQALDNIINKITDGVQKEKIYEINEQLVDLHKPMMTESAISDLEHLIDGTLDSSGRELKNVLMMMKRDGLDRIIGETRYPDYLIPFKKLIDREKNFIND